MDRDPPDGELAQSSRGNRTRIVGSKGSSPHPDREAGTERSDGELRSLESTDWAHCLDLDRRALGGLWSESQWIRELEDEGRPCLGLWQGKRLVAMATGWLILDELHITAVAVDPDERRRGHGSRVLTAFLEHGKRCGACHATLEVAAPNLAARRLYEAAGFQEAGIRRAYYQNGDDALIQWKRLTPEQPVR